MKEIIILTITTIVLVSCSIDIRQLPSPKKNEETVDNSNRNKLSIREFKIINNDLLEIESAWKYIFISFLKNDIFIKNNYTIIETNDQIKDSISLNIKIIPDLNEERNYWWSIPIIYPVTLIWPIHFRQIEYKVKIEYSIEKNGDLILEDSFEFNDNQKIYFYGLIRTSVFEESIEDINKKVLEECVSKISLRLYQ
ncbi:LBF_2127 family putative lipoprotein [Leptospira meyeri]|uniref:LBF_2127 family putative lipoprotein n=1 Tax=Leptospira meyeri TaxID=29508 RepID=UPI00223DD275|nr:hypothetical protein [Leptospira meyeri]MCW7490938.1 hypothetical protein [Leptospira meyeri]